MLWFCLCFANFRFYLAGVVNPPEPLDPCNPTPCGANSECGVAEGRPVCSCLPGYFGAPPGCRPECVMNRYVVK